MQRTRTKRSALSQALMVAAMMGHGGWTQRQIYQQGLKTEDPEKIKAAEEKRERRKARNLSNAAFCNTMKVG